MEQIEEAGLEEVNESLFRVAAGILICFLFAAPQIRPLAVYWQDRGRGDYQARRQCHASVYRCLDGDGVVTDWYV